MTEHTPTPWGAASAYSSICGVPIISQKGGRVANTALPDMPKEWDELKQRAVADAAFICKAVNNHDALVEALQALVDQVNDYERVNNLAPNPGRAECWDTVARAKEVLAKAR